MKIIELESTDAFEELKAIIKSHLKAGQSAEPQLKQLKKEQNEIGGNRLFCAGFIKGLAVAMIQIVLHNADNNPELANGKEICHLHNLQVKSELQRQGIGRRMMDYAEDRARELGKKVLTLGVDGNNFRAIKMYEKRGYRVFSEEKGLNPDEICYCMRKYLE